MLILDLFRRPFNFLLPDDQSKYRTFLGGILSIVTFVILLSYGGYNLALHYNRSEFTINQTRQSYYFDLDENFSNSDGLAIAGAILGYDSNGMEDYYVDPEIGQLKFILKSWDITNADVSKNYLQFNPIKAKPCAHPETISNIQNFYPKHKSENFT